MVGRTPDDHEGNAARVIPPFGERGGPGVDGAVEVAIRVGEGGARPGHGGQQVGHPDLWSTDGSLEGGGTPFLRPVSIPWGNGRTPSQMGR